MGKPRPPQKVKLIVGMLSGDVDLLARAQKLLGRTFGTVELQSDVWPFDATDYYEAEMGPQLKRKFVAFAECIQPDALAEIKRTTNDLEARICEDMLVDPDRRPVNLDPGYVALGKVVLATTKDHAHRIYVQRGIYAEVTLKFEHGAWRPWPWTYPDYVAGTYYDFFTQVRERLHQQLHTLSDQP